MRDITRKEFLRRAGAGAIAGSLLGAGCITVKATDATGLTPSAGQTVVAPRLKASTFDTGVGILIKQDNVTVVNPRIEDFSQGVEVAPKADGTPPKNIRVIFDAGAQGAADARIFHCRIGVKARRFDGLEIGSVTPGNYFVFRDNYRNIMFHGGTGGEFHHCDILGPSYTFPAGNGEVGSIVGIKGLSNTSDGPPYVTSGISIHDNVVGRFSEEGISLDAGSDTGPPVREMDKVAAVSASAHYVDLASTAWEGRGDVYGGYYLAFTHGAAAGEVLYIKGQSAKRLHLSDPHDVLSQVQAGNVVVICMPYLRNRIENNTIDTTRAKAGITTEGCSFYGVLSGNRVSGYTDYDYPDEFMLRRSGGVTAPQAIRVASLAGHYSSGSLVSELKRAPAARHTIVGNVCDGDLSLHLIRLNEDHYHSPNYWARNTFTGSGQLWVRNHASWSPPA